MSNKVGGRHRRHRKTKTADPTVDLDAARKQVRARPPDQVFGWMVDMSVKRQTIPVSLLVAACEHIGGGRPGGTDQAFKDLEAACVAGCGLPLPIASDRRGASM